MIVFFRDERSVPPDKLTLDRIDPVAITAFLNWLQVSRHNSVSTRNQRLAAISSFSRWMLSQDPTRMAPYQDILAIPAKRAPRPAVHHLTVEQTREFIEIRPLSLSGPRPGKYRFDSFEGGAAGTTGTGGVSLRSSSAVWKDTSFVVTEERSITQDGNVTHQSKHQEVWSIQCKKLLIILITDEETGIASTTTRFVYRKRR